MTDSTLTVLVLLSLLRHCIAAIDFCEADPRVEVTRSVCPGVTSPSLLIHVRPLDGNPYHSVHDTLWPVAHYLSHCTRSLPPGAITLLVRYDNNYNASGCVGDKVLPPNGPYWALCAVHALAASVGGQVLGTPNVDTLPDQCFDKTVQFGVRRHVASNVYGVGHMRDDFRAMSFFGRTCAGAVEADCDPTVANRSMLIPMPARMKTDALKYLRNSVMRLVDASVPEEEPGRKIRVLMYDRNDTSRRQWTNTEPIHELLQKDERVEARFVRATPKTLKGQVELYAWPDVLVAPHGAAMVNTIFQREGTEVVEGRKLCDEYVGRDRFVPNDWTGWHATLMNINVQYVQCHRAEGDFKESHQLLERERGPPTNGQHKYRVEEVAELLETALERQAVRLRDMDSGDNSGFVAGFADPVGVHVKKVINAMGTDDGTKWAPRVSMMVVGSVCFTLIMVRRACKAKKMPILTE